MFPIGVEKREIVTFESSETSLTSLTDLIRVNHVYRVSYIKISSSLISNDSVLTGQRTTKNQILDS